MKKRSIFMMIYLSILLALTPALPAQASGAGFTSTITYQNIGSDVAHITIQYYADGSSTPTIITQPDLQVGASQTVALANLNPTTGGTRGAAIIRSDMEIAVLTTQIPVSTSIIARGLASPASTGSGKIWLPALRKVSKETELLAIQNMDTVSADLKITFFGSAAPIIINRTNIPANGSIYIELATVTELPTTFIGTALVEAFQSGTTIAGKVNGMVAHTFETATEAYATESQASGAKKIFMPIALCYGMGNMNTTYYVFNTDPTTTATITVTYNTGKTQTTTLAGHGQTYLNACTPSGTVNGYSGSAIITSSGPALLVVGNIKLMGMAASFLGQSVGSKKLALPLVQYSTANYTNGNKYRTTISVMNLGASLAAGTVKARYYGRDGSLVGVYSFPAFPAGGRLDTNPSQLGTPGAEFGYYTDGNDGGSVVIEGPTGSSLMAVAWMTRVASTGLYTGETYNAVSIAGQ